MEKETFVGTAEAANFIGKPVSWLYGPAPARYGVPRYKVGNHYRYRLSELEAWLKSGEAPATRPPLSLEAKAEIAARYLSDPYLRQQDLALEYGVSQGTVSQAVSIAAPERRRRRRRPEIKSYQQVRAEVIEAASADKYCTITLRALVLADTPRAAREIADAWVRDHADQLEGTFKAMYTIDGDQP